MDNSNRIMTFEELAKDHQFIEGLRIGDFCLVLGAGFSYGISENCRIKNNAIHGNPLYHNIPTTKDFIDITNIEFSCDISEFNAAVLKWEKVLGENDEKSKLFRNMFLADTEYFIEKIFPLYKNILIPNWYRVFTFNFDNVFELIARENYLSISYPDDHEFISTNKKQIAHIHGIVTENSNLLSLVFFGKNYAALHKSNNDLYNSLINSVNYPQKKGLIIVGCRFNETIQIQKFHDAVQGAYKPLVYHIGLDRPDFSGGNDHLDYRFIKSSTSDFLEFLGKSRSLIEKINVDGSITIDSTFITEKTIKGEERGFTPTDFYLAKQENDCQWYGIVKDWVIERTGYDYIKSEILKSFNHKYRLAKITAIIWGSGGCGKSTLLRKIAVDFSNEDFAVLWIKDLQTFVDGGLAQIKKEYTNKRFLILIEDFYKINQQHNNGTLKNYITNICAYDNIRIIIGDRKGNNGAYTEHIYNSEKNTIKLVVDDNKTVFEKILAKNEDWKEAANSLQITENDFKKPIYYILWVVGRTVQRKKTSTFTINSEDLTGHFRGLIRSDLNELEKNYQGVAKLLHYWALMNKDRKVYISYDLFISLADIFKEPSSQNSSSIISTDLEKSILDIYAYSVIGIIKSSGELPLIAFNQDILAEELSETKWQMFDDSIKLKILDKIIEIGDDYSASAFLFYCLTNIPQERFTVIKKKEYITKLLKKNNYGSYLYYPLNDNKVYEHDEKKKLAEQILNKEKFWELDSATIYKALEITKNKTKADEILSQQNFWKLHKDIVSNALTLSKNKEKANEILSQEKFWDIHKDIVSKALTLSKNEEKANELLSQEKFWNLPKEIINAALEVSQNKGKANEILSLANCWEFPISEIVCKALTISQNKEKANEFLNRENFWELQNDIVCTSLKLSQSKDKANEVLEQDNFWKLPNDIVCTALKISENEKKAEAIVCLHNFLERTNDLVSIAFRLATDNELKERVAQEFLAKNCWREKWSVTYQILNYYSECKVIPENVKDICKSVIKEYFDRKCSDKFKSLRYVELMKIPLHSIEEWKNSSLINIEKWRKRNRKLVASTIKAYINRPNDILIMCESIMLLWKEEIVNSRGYVANHIILSMGHPKLKTLAKETASAILKSYGKDPSFVPEYLLEISKKITNENIYPAWEKEDEAQLI